MPGAHLDLKIMQCWSDVGGCDCWVGGFWDDLTATQWWSGWHLPGPAGLAGLNAWSWPNPHWTLIGYELWAYYRKGNRKIEAMYQHPNPGTTPAGQVLAQPSGHWHYTYHPNGTLNSSAWIPRALDDNHLYLKGGVTGNPKGGTKGGKGQGGPKGGEGGPKGGKGQGKGKKGGPKGGESEGSD